MDSLRQAYDDIPYPFLCFNQSHPHRLAAIATLLGLDPPPVPTARVLELGCAMGGNLIPMAEGLPEATFLGLDLAPRQIEMGQALVDRLGLDNIILKAQDIRRLRDDAGPFDYIIAHGLYSWSPPDVRERLLDICRRHLSPQGVAYVSYNTYPGWYRTQRLREMLLYHLRDEPDRTVWPDRARDYLHFLLDSVAALAPPPEKGHGTFYGTYHSLLAEYLASVRRQDAHQRDTLMLHDELGEVNQPVYFNEFIAHAERHGLQYLAEAEFPEVMVGNLPPAVARGLSRYSKDLIELEQQIDFVRNRTFRQTLLVRAEAPVTRALDPARLQSLAVASRASLKQINPETGLVIFQGEDGSQFKSDHPLTRTAFFYLTQMTPRAVPFEELLAVARENTYRDGVPAAEVQAQDAQLMAANLLQAYSYSMKLVELYGAPPRFELEPGERPTAAPLARIQAARGEKATNRRHERVELDPVTRRLLPLLDGKHNRRALAGDIRRWAEAGEITLAEDEGPISDSMVQQELEGALTWLARTALLV